ncbi:LysE family translocator [Pseudoalteromonas sp. T1lg24]|uniref:LysE family translocator n=1 Tax=Pseudoalteromonas sp. T1lg24 TaxID=2077099 RepID=UPI000CF65AB5|nr:LysE family translocator [Pseudoalteromonas sp. T1lg24]
METSTVLSLLPALILFSISATLTPGPNNILLAYSGANFDFRKTLPHIVGIRIGMTCMHLAMLLGLGKLFEQYPMLHQVLSVFAASYIIYLAIKIVRGKPNSSNSSASPMTFSQAALFQLVNPKSWAMLLTLVTALTLPNEQYWPSALLGVIVFNLATLPCSFFWVAVGRFLNGFLQNPQKLKRFNLVMASLLLLTLPLIFY